MDVKDGHDAKDRYYTKDGSSKTLIYTFISSKTLIYLHSYVIEP